MNFIKNKDLIGLKRRAMELAPGGAPDFQKILRAPDVQELSVWNRVNGKSATTKYIVLLLEDLNNYFNISRPLTNPQIVELAMEFVDQYWWVKMEDLLAFFEAIKKGTFGKVYERLDPSIIWEQWDAYEAQRTRFCEDRAMSQNYKDPALNDSNGNMERRMDGFAGALSAFKNKFQRPKK